MYNFRGIVETNYKSSCENIVVCTTVTQTNLLILSTSILNLEIDLVVVEQ